MSIRPGILGIGSMGQHHVRNVCATAGVDLVAPADPSGDRFGVTGDLPVLGGVEEVTEVGISVAIIAAPTAHHEAAALALAEVGVYTLVEKPLVASVEMGRHIRDASVAAGLIGAVGYAERCNLAFIDIRRRIAEGQFGAIEQIVTRRQSPFSVRISDVGVVKDLATHDVDLAAWVAGTPYESTCMRMPACSGRMHGDMMIASGVLAGGILVNCFVNWLTPFKDCTTIVTGGRGVFVVDTAMGDLTLYENGHAPLQWDVTAALCGASEGQAVCYTFTKREPLALEHERFRDAILGAGSEHVTMDEALDNLRVVEAILSPVTTGHSVDL